MRRPLVLVKLGGSILSNKHHAGDPRFLRSRANDLAHALARVHKTHDLLLVLGAGSWGHPQALRHRVGQRRLQGKAATAALREIHESVGELRSRFCQTALRQGLPVLPIPAHGLVGPSTEYALRWQPLQWCVENALVAVTGGDAVADPRLGIRILSGDEIARVLVERLKVTRVVFATDVPGVRVADEYAATLHAEEIRRLLPSLPRGSDATGGMRGKLEQALQILDQGVEVRIVDGRQAASLARAVRGQGAGTLLRP